MKSIYVFLRYIYTSIFVFFKKNKMKKIKIEKNFDIIVDDIIKNNYSLARYGDGEFRIMLGIDPGSFQKYNERLSEKLKEVLSTDRNDILVGINYSLINLNGIVYKSKVFWSWFIYKYFDKIYKYINTNKNYVDAAFSRMYLRESNKAIVKRKFEKIKMIWNNKKVLIVEGKDSKLGVGNDLFKNTESIKRILCPSTNSFDVYDEIMREVKKYSKDHLVIIALGATATVLAYDLTLDGYQALDLGHIDIEYEWFLRGAKTAISIPGKYTNEVDSDDKVQGNIDTTSYEKEVVKIINK